MLLIDRELAFILKRTPYKENQYLLDIFTQNHGRLRAIGRIANQKTHRETENFAPFRALAISGTRKADLLNLQQSEIIRSYSLIGTDFLSATYINELLLSHILLDEADDTLFTLYQQALANPQAASLRKIEFHLIYEKGILPERQINAPYYQLFLVNGWFELRPAKQGGYQHEMVTAVEIGKLPLHHPQLRHYLQTLLKNATHHQQHSKRTTTALLQLIKKDTSMLSTK